MRDLDGDGSQIFVDVEITVPAARLGEFERGYPEVATRMVGIPGYLREELLHEPGSDTFHIFAEWGSEEQFYRWIGDPAHAQEEAGPIAPFLLATSSAACSTLGARSRNPASTHAVRRRRT